MIRHDDFMTTVFERRIMVKISGDARDNHISKIY